MPVLNSEIMGKTLTLICLLVGLIYIYKEKCCVGLGG